MISRIELKQRARKVISGNIGYLLVCALIIIVINAIIGIPQIIATLNGIQQQVETSSSAAQLAVGYGSGSGYATLSWLQVISGLLSFFVGVPLASGYAYVVMRLYHDPKDHNFKYIFAGFRKGYYIRLLLVDFLASIFLALWTCLLVVPGIIKSFAYSQAVYLVLEDPTISAMGAIKKSNNIMKGHKMELFVLIISFILWILLAYVTVGIALIFVGPYMEATMIAFHRVLVRKDPSKDMPEYTFVER